MSSYVFSEQHNFQTVLWAAAGAVGQLCRHCGNLSTMGLAVSLWAYTLLMAVWPDVALLCASVAKVATYALAIVGAYAVVTMPKAVRNG